MRAAAAHDAAVAGALDALSPSAAALRRMIAPFHHAMAEGLAGRQSSLKMLPTFVDQPSGEERGRVAVVDWGGTHGRVALLELCARGRCRVLAEDDVRFSEADKTGTPAAVFDIVADTLGRLVAAAGRRGTAPLPVGFAYSFPARLDGLDRAIAIGLTKGWHLGGLVGRDVGALLEAALQRRGVSGSRVAAVTNDTVAALALVSYRARGLDPDAPPADIGLIVGTGTNQAADLGAAGVRNLESGNFDGVGELATQWDEALDRELTDCAPGAQRFEKMAAGHYLGEILRRALRSVAASSALFQRSAVALDTSFLFDGAHVSALAADASSDLARAGALLRCLGIGSAAEERRAAVDLARAVGRRSARLIAAALVGTLTFIDGDLRRPQTVAVDGSVWGGFPGFPRMVRAGLAELAGRERAGRVRLCYVRDSTAAGAAVIAVRAQAAAAVIDVRARGAAPAPRLRGRPSPASARAHRPPARSRGRR